MIDFRYHLVSIIAIFFALAAGIALGAGPLKPGVDQGLATQTADLRKANQDLRDQVTQLGIQAQYQEEFVASVAPALVSDRLLGRRVVVFAMPDASSDLVDALRENLKQSGASLGPTVSIQPEWTDPDREEQLGDLVDEFASPSESLPEGDSWTKGAGLLSGALLSPGQGPVGAVNPAVIDGFQEAGLVEVEGELGGEADLALVVAGPPLTGDDADRQLTILTSLVDQTDEAGLGSVVAGAPPSAGEGGLINVVRNGDVGEQVSTVDVAHLQSGQLTVVFTLDERAGGKTGHYGIVGTTDGPLPESIAEAADAQAGQQ